MIRALLYLRSWSLRNRTLASVKRLRQLKYLVSFLAGIAYVYFFFLRRFHLADAGLAGRSFAFPVPTIATLGAAILFVMVFVNTLYVWNSAQPAARLRFTESEIAFLFPAPLSQRRLIHFNLLSGQFSILLSSLILTLLLDRWRFLGGNALTHAIGWWLILSTLTLWRDAMNFLASRALEIFGLSVRRRVLMLLVIAGVLLARSLWVHAHPPDRLDPNAIPVSMAAFLARWVTASFGAALLLPFRWVITPFAAPTIRAFLLALGPALLLPAVCYAVIVFLEIPFRDGSIVYAGRKAQTRALRRTGGPATRVTLKPRRSPFNLGGAGRPEFAFFWKNLILIQSWFNLRVVAVLLVAGTLVVFNVAHPSHGAANLANPDTRTAVIVFTLAALGGFYVMLLGPQLIRQDLRSDLLNADLFKAYPLAGWQIVGGQMLTPALILAGLLWVAALAAGWAVFSGFGPAEVLSVGMRLTLLLCVAVVIPPVVLLQLVIPNAAALLFPAWHQITRSRTGGIEVIGQRLIFTFGQFIAAVIALIPAAMLAVAVAVSGGWYFGEILGLVCAAIAVVAVVGGEVWIGLWWLGERFEKLDIATELR